MPNTDKYIKWVEANPDAGDLVARAADSKNSFVRDVVGKLKYYGSISEKQKSAVLQAMQRDTDRANAPKEVVGDAPTGRVEIEGVIVCTKVKETDFGSTLKMLVKLDNGATVWCSVPNSLHDDVDQAVKKLHGDNGFAFGKRPCAHLIALPVAEPVPVKLAAPATTNSAAELVFVQKLQRRAPEARMELAQKICDQVSSGLSLVDLANALTAKGAV